MTLQKPIAIGGGGELSSGVFATVVRGPGQLGSHLVSEVESQCVQESAEQWSLGCVKRAPVARGGQDAGITQPRDHPLADPCTVNPIYLGKGSCAHASGTDSRNP